MFPKKSLSGQSGEWITVEERRQLASFPVLETTQELRNRGLKSIDRICAGSSYQNCSLLKKAIHTFKYRRITVLAQDLTELMLKNAPDFCDAVLCPVPLHWTRKFSRGFNQSQLLAEIVGEKLHMSVQTLLKRTRPTGHQVGRPRRERLTALKDAFKATTEKLPPNVILIDDLTTTGATLDECAKELKKSGAKEVYGWVIAHG